MKITDLYGASIEVTDLNKAIEMTDYFKDAEHIPPVASDKERKAYWGDMHSKLLQLKKQLLNASNSNEKFANDIP